MFRGFLNTKLALRVMVMEVMAMMPKFFISITLPVI